MERKRRWESIEVKGGYPPDLTSARTGFAYDPCHAEWQCWICTRLDGHTGRHAAGDGRVVCAVWP